MSKSPKKKPFAFHSLPKDAFPLWISIYDEMDPEKKLLWSGEVNGPGSTEIPGFAPHPVGVILDCPMFYIEVNSRGETIRSIRKRDFHGNLD